MLLFLVEIPKLLENSRKKLGTLSATQGIFRDSHPSYWCCRSYTTNSADISQANPCR